MNKKIVIALMCLFGIMQSVAQKSVRTINGKEVVLHKVLPKESWISISRDYALTMDELKAVNPGIAELKIGQIINIPLLPEPSVAKNQSRPDKFVTPAAVAVPEQTALTDGTPVYHSVAKGETMYSISKSNSVSAEQIKKWNSLEGTGLKLGQKIIVGYRNLLQDSQSPTPSQLKLEQVPVKAVAQPEIKMEAKSAPAPIQMQASKSQSGISEKSIAALKNEQNEQPVVTKKSNGSAIVEISETGMASWIRDGSMNQNKYFALHRTAPAGTIIKVSNRMNGDYVFVKVVGQLPESGDNDKQIVKISEAAAKKIGAINEHFQVELNYGLLQ